MKEKKHIDRIFQEQLKNFDATPNDAVWNRIQSELHQEHADRKVIPIWWKIAGIAASLLLLFTVGYSVFNNDVDTSSDTSIDIVDTKNDADSPQEKNNKEVQNSEDKDTPAEVFNNNLVPENQTASSENDDSKTGASGVSTSKTDNTFTSTENNSQRKDAVVNSNQLNAHKRNDVSNFNTVISQNTNQEKTSVAVTQQNLEDKTNDTSSKKTLTKEATTNNTVIATNKIPQNLPEQPTENNDVPKNIKNPSLNPLLKEGNAVAENSATNLPKTLTEEQKDTKEQEAINNNTDVANPTIEEAVAASEDGEDYDEKEKEVIDRWSVAANVSPVYYNTLGKGSSIHDQFNKNAKKGQLNMAYGVNASYAISEKLSVRSGIGRVNVGYNTNDIVVFNSLGTPEAQPVASANGAVFRNIDLKEEAEGITIISGETLAFAQVPGVVAQNLKSTLNQEMSFIEIPVELEYKLSDKKLGISLIGGFSTMILEGNEVYTELNDERTLLGEANNINSISYSANFGVGLGVKISEKINLNFEPTFKYQIKTFNNTSGDFKPYIIGVNSGIKFKF